MSNLAITRLQTGLRCFGRFFYNWFQYIQNGSLELKSTTFRFVVISDRDITTGSIPESFNKADSIDKARTAIKEAQIVLWGAKEELKGKVPEGYKKFLDALFNPGNAAIVEQIVLDMKIEIYSSDYDDKLYKKFCGQTIPLEYAENLFEYMQGWVYERVNAQTKRGEPAYISCKDFRDALVTQTRRYNQSATLAWATTRPSDDAAQYEFEKQDIYIKQLDLIQLDISDKMQAASDYLRTSSEKTKWADRGIIAPQDFDEYYDSLVDMWHSQSRLASLSSPPNEMVNGQRVYYSCKEVARSVKIQGMDTPNAFGSGSLHALANAPEDEPKIGWHPAYKDLLKAEVDASE